MRPAIPPPTTAMRRMGSGGVRRVRVWDVHEWMLVVDFDVDVEADMRGGVRGREDGEEEDIAVDVTVKFVKLRN